MVRPPAGVKAGAVQVPTRLRSGCRSMTRVAAVTAFAICRYVRPASGWRAIAWTTSWVLISLGVILNAIVAASSACLAWSAPRWMGRGGSVLGPPPLLGGVCLASRARVTFRSPMRWGMVATRVARLVSQSRHRWLGVAAAQFWQGFTGRSPSRLWCRAVRWSRCS